MYIIYNKKGNEICTVFINYNTIKSSISVNKYVTAFNLSSSQLCSGFKTNLHFICESSCAKKIVDACL